MFSDACRMAGSFTRPVVMSARFVDGRCASGIGSFVVINPDGWAVTALHIMNEVSRQTEAANNYQAAEAARQAIYADKTLHKKERGTRLKALPQKNNDSITHSSGWWSWDNLIPDVEYYTVPSVDLAVIHFNGFNPAWVTNYPVFKDPTRSFDPGRSLCRLGFPFHEITPVFDTVNNRFELPPGSLPLPRFPNDGIFTREVHVLTPGNVQPFPLKFIETSSPGLRGQSGGPIYDTKGTIWGIQSRTVHLPLGFNPPVPGGKTGQTEHQFLNIGLGTHAETVVAALRHFGVSFSLSDY